MAKFVEVQLLDADITITRLYFVPKQIGMS